MIESGHRLISGTSQGFPNRSQVALWNAHLALLARSEIAFRNALALEIQFPLPIAAAITRRPVADCPIRGIRTSVDGLQPATSDSLPATSDALPSTSGSMASVCGIRRSVCGIRRSVNDLRGSVNDLRTSVNDLRTSVNDLRTSVNDLRTSVNDLRTSVNDLRKSVNDLRKSVNDLRKSVNDLRKSVNDLRTSVNDLRRSVNDLRNGERIIIPTGFNNTAQGCGTPLPWGIDTHPFRITPTGLRPFWRHAGFLLKRRNPVGVVGWRGGYRTQGSGVPQPWAMLRNPVGILDRHAGHGVYARVSSAMLRNPVGVNNRGVGVVYTQGSGVPQPWAMIWNPVGIWSLVGLNGFTADDDTELSKDCRPRHCEARSNLVLREGLSVNEIASYLAMTVVFRLVSQIVSALSGHSLFATSRLRAFALPYSQRQAAQLPTFFTGCRHSVDSLLNICEGCTP